MTCTEEYKEHIEYTFHAFCVVVIRNAKFAEKGLTVRIDHRSYERQGVDLLPTIHEGATVRAMEKKGIPHRRKAPPIRHK